MRATKFNIGVKKFVTKTKIRAFDGMYCNDKKFGRKKIEGISINYGLLSMVFPRSFERLQ